MTRWLAGLIVAGLSMSGCASSTQENSAVTVPAPPPNTGPGAGVASPTFRFAVVGDFGAGGPAESAVAAEMRTWARTHPLDALVTTGDNVYPWGDPPFFDRAWRKPYSWAIAEDIDVIASLGNHDRNQYGEPEIKLFGLPGAWYEKTIGDADIVVLDANRADDPEQLQWLTSTLRTLHSRWQIVVFHQPAYSCAFHDSTPLVDELWVPLFDKWGVDLVLNGHDHDYQRFAADDGIAYVVTGGGGNEDLYSLEECPDDTPKRVAGDDKHHHFLTIQGNDRRLRLKAIATDGSLLDDVTLVPRRR